MKKIIIGLVGPIASGKGEVANFFRQNNFSYFSLSDRVREEAKKRELKIERETLQNVGDSLRKEFGNDILAKRTAAMIKQKNSRIIIDSIRNPGEIKFLKDNLEIFIIGVTASKEIRLERFLKRNRLSDPKTKEDFYKVDSRDSGEEQELHGQQVQTCLKMSDLVIENNGTFDDLKNKIEIIFKNISKDNLV